MGVGVRPVGEHRVPLSSVHSPQWADQEKYLHDIWDPTLLEAMCVWAWGVYVCRAWVYVSVMGRAPSTNRGMIFDLWPLHFYLGLPCACRFSSALRAPGKSSSLIVCCLWAVVGLWHLWIHPDNRGKPLGSQKSQSPETSARPQGIHGS